MEKQLILKEQDALRLYPTADPAMKELLELNFGKEFFNQKITDRIQKYEDILAISGTKESDDEVSIKGFNSSENELVKNLIKKIRVCKVYNEGWLPKRGDQRWYNWYNVSSGFVFFTAGYVAAGAFTSSASRLCLKSRALSEDFDKKFAYIDKAIISVE